MTKEIVLDDEGDLVLGGASGNNDDLGLGGTSGNKNYLGLG